ncbi:MAG TPA: 1-deoxy-D-xylulose-5-phosphate reductoisomerase [Candidatus Eisenbacteria bacterium]|nr:1-deoxy-D-xylulose-5-phosphate reductoisomerase [Candidatus Eisenbacteria bacterium]
MKPLRIALLGATGSIGTAALQLAREHPDRLSFVSMAARTSDSALVRAAREFGVGRIALDDTAAAARARAVYDGDVLEGSPGLEALADDADADIVVNALVGVAGLRPTLSALRAGKRVALANKESIVVAGELVTAVAARHGGVIVPVDSEHGGLHQCLEGRAADDVRRVLLTASGGPFLRHDPASVDDASPEDVLRHPTWSMGPRITVDSATLVNKGFEVIEARWLFGLAPAQLDVVIHPQSIVHAVVEFRDGSLVAQLSVPDMRLPLLYALTYPERWTSALPRLDLASVGSLHFESPDPRRAPGLALARRALERGGTAPAVLNGADEEAVRLFLDRKIRFGDVTRLVGEVLDAHAPQPALTLEAVEGADRWARARLHEAAASRLRS